MRNSLGTGVRCSLSRRRRGGRQGTEERREIDLDSPMDEESRRSILARALGTDQVDAEGMLGKIRARFQSCAPRPFTISLAITPSSNKKVARITIVWVSLSL